MVPILTLQRGSQALCSAIKIVWSVRFLSVAVLSAPKAPLHAGPLLKALIKLLDSAMEGGRYQA